MKETIKRIVIFVDLNLMHCYPYKQALLFENYCHKIPIYIILEDLTAKAMPQYSENLWRSTQFFEWAHLKTWLIKKVCCYFFTLKLLSSTSLLPLSHSLSSNEVVNFPSKKFESLNLYSLHLRFPYARSPHKLS